MKPLVAIVGRPNVGKSTFFNRLVGRRVALVEDQPGVTRDRHYADALWNNKTFTLVDTGGFTVAEDDVLLSDVRAQAQLAVDESDAVLFLVDGRAGLTGPDQEVARVLRRSGKRVFLAANKADMPDRGDALLSEFHRLGFPASFAISAEHGHGIGELLDRLTAPWDEDVEAPEMLEGEDGPIRLAVIGRPNVGKSTLINALLKQPRMVASDLPGTTRDPIDTQITFQNRAFILTDTAGIRRRSSVQARLEKVSVLAALRAVERSDLAALVLDATEPGVDQDARLASLVEERGRGLIVVVNKWDLARKAEKTEDEFRTFLKARLKFMAYAPIIFTAAKDGLRVTKVLEVAAQLAEQFRFRATTPALNRVLAHVTDAHPAPVVKGKPLRLYFIRQVKTAPPTFTVVCNRPPQIPESYRRYLVNQLRDTFKLKVPLHLIFKERPGQAKRAARKRSK